MRRFYGDRTARYLRLAGFSVASAGMPLKVNVPKAGSLIPTFVDPGDKAKQIDFEAFDGRDLEACQSPQIEFDAVPLSVKPA